MLHAQRSSFAGLLGTLLTVAFLSVAPHLAAQSVILSSDFTGRTISGSTYNNITWTGADATSSASSLQAIRINNSGFQIRGIDGDVPGYLNVSSGNGLESWIIDVPFTATANVSVGQLTIGWASSHDGLSSPGFGFAIYSAPAASSNLNQVPFGGGPNALGYAITGTVQPSGTGALTSAMTGNVTPVDAQDTAHPQTMTLEMLSQLGLIAGDNYVLRVAVFDNQNAYNTNIYLDSLTLSASSAIPEPGVYAAVLGAAALGACAVMKLRRRSMAATVRE